MEGLCFVMSPLRRNYDTTNFDQNQPNTPVSYHFFMSDPYTVRSPSVASKRFVSIGAPIEYLPNPKVSGNLGAKILGIVGKAMVKISGDFWIW